MPPRPPRPRRQSPKSSGTHKGNRNYFWSISRDPYELDWVRASTFEGHDLPRPIVLVNGGFDLLHKGHMRMLFAAREKAATLVVAMDSDRRIRGAKGPARPIMTWTERAATLGYMPIDYLVEIDSDTEMRDLINALRPDLRVQGGQYAAQSSKYPWLRKMFIQDSTPHTTDIIQRIISRHVHPTT